MIGPPEPDDPETLALARERESLPGAVAALLRDVRLRENPRYRAILGHFEALLPELEDRPFGREDAAALERLLGCDRTNAGRWLRRLAQDMERVLLGQVGRPGREADGPAAPAQPRRGAPRGRTVPLERLVDAAIAWQKDGAPHEGR